MRKLMAFFLIIGSAAVLISCGGNDTEVAHKEKAVPVTIAEVESNDISVKMTYSGTLEGEQQAQIFASIPEAVVELPVKEGSEVKAGAPVILLDKNGMASHYNQSRAVVLQARDNFDKMAKLYQQGAVSEQAYIGARTGLEVAEANFASARQQVELTSPISGILTDISVNIGEYAPMGIPLATVARTDFMRLTLFVDSRGAAIIKNGDKAIITVDSKEKLFEEYTGKVIETARSADPQTRLFRIEVKIPNPKGELIPGMFARAELTVLELKNVPAVPREAVFSVEGVHKLFMLSGDRAVERTVTIGESTKELAQVISGASPGDTVVVVGRNLIEDGTLVKISNLLDSSVENSKRAIPESEG